jgi:hypothetical protein
VKYDLRKIISSAVHNGYYSFCLVRLYLAKRLYIMEQEREELCETQMGVICFILDYFTAAVYSRSDWVAR